MEFLGGGWTPQNFFQLFPLKMVYSSVKLTSCMLLDALCITNVCIMRLKAKCYARKLNKFAWCFNPNPYPHPLPFQLRLCYHLTLSAVDYPSVLFVCQWKNTEGVLSNDAVSFHYVSPGEMYMFDFLLYRLNRHRTVSATDRPPIALLLVILCSICLFILGLRRR